MTIPSLQPLVAHLKELAGRDLPAAMRTTVETMLNQIASAEVSERIGAQPGERTPTRTTQRNGYRRRKLETQLGTLEVAIPKLREGSYLPTFLEPRCRIHTSLIGVVQDAYVQGLSTRRIEDLAQVLGIEHLSKSAVSRLLETLDSEVTSFRERPLKTCRYVFIDARYEKVHEANQVVSKALYVAVGVSDDGQREVLGFTVAPQEDTVNWEEFLRSLVSRGLDGVRLVISDAHRGIREAVCRVFGAAGWQRCTIHLQRQLMGAVGHRHRNLVQSLFKMVVQAGEITDARHHLALMQRVLEESRLDKAARILEAAGEEFLTAFGFPSAHRRKIHSTNLVERLNREIKRRTRVVGIFPNEQGLIRLAGSVLRRTHLAWAAESQRYMSLRSMMALAANEEEANRLLQRYEEEGMSVEVA